MKDIIKLEWRLIRTARLTWYLAGSMLLLIFFAVQMRTEKVMAYQITTDSLYKEENRRINDYAVQLDSVQKDVKKQKGSLRQSYLNPYSLVFKTPLHAFFSIDERAVISTGRSAVYTNYFVNNAWKTPILSFETPNNPYQQLFGMFDLAFVLVYLLPLFIIAFAFNLVSLEKEQGTLRLLLSFPVSPFKIFLTKTLVRVSFFFGVVVFSLVLSFLANHSGIFAFAGSILSLFALILVYIMFWFLLCLSVNLRGWSTSTNAFVLTGCWMFFLLIVPVLINMIANIIYPVPSRTKYTAQYWTESVVHERTERSKILDRYFQDHPELVVRRDTLDITKEWQELFGFYKAIVAQLETTDSMLAPLTNEYNVKMAVRKRLVEKASLFSPAALFKNSLDNLAGTSDGRYQVFYEQAEQRRKAFNEFLRQKIFQEDLMTKEDVAKLPEFQQTMIVVKDADYFSEFVMVAYVLFIILLLAWQKMKFKYEYIL
ncbi:MAG: DUF3526 domain-containing protein [Chitinophagaceae bacterium]